MNSTQLGQGHGFCGGGPEPYSGSKLSFANDYYARMGQAIEYLQSRIKFAPEIAIVCGSGLGNIAERINDPLIIPTSDVPNFPHSSVDGHAGNLVFGELAGKRVVAQQGRVHRYELAQSDSSLFKSNPEAWATFPTRVLAGLGANAFVLTNAAGAINPEFKPGDVMFITNHTSRVGTRVVFHPALGPMFPDQSMPYDAGLISLGLKVAAEVQTKLGPSPLLRFQSQFGAYVQNPGPQYESALEIYEFGRQLKQALLDGRPEVGLGAVGMSTAIETIALRQFNPGIRILGISLITNMGAGILPQALSHKEVKETAAAAAPYMEALIEGIVAGIKPSIAQPD